MKTIATTLKKVFLLISLFAATNSFSQVVADFTADIACNQAPVNFTNNSTGSIISYEWTFQGGSPASSTSINPVTTWNTTGVYEVTLIVNDGQAQDTATQYVNVYPTPGTNVYMTGGLSCNGGMDTLKSNVYGGTPPYTFSWSPGGETTENIYVGAGSYSVLIYDANGCQAGGSGNVLEPSPIDIVMADTSLCQGESAVITPLVSGGTPNYTYYWEQTFETTQSIVVSPSTSTMYYVNVTDANGCSENDTMMVDVYAAPFADNEFISMCEEAGGMSDFDLVSVEEGITGGADVTLNWFEDFELLNPISTPESYFSFSDTVHVEVVSNQNGCKSQSYVQLVVKDSSSNVIYGKVLFESVEIFNGEAFLYRKDGPSPDDIYLRAFQFMEASGTFQFNGVSSGDYFLKADGYNGNYNNAPTYSGNSGDWSDATVISVLATCDDTTNMDIELIVLPEITGGGTINGRLIEDDGQGGTFKAPGDPIGDIDITVEQSPGGSVMASTTTDMDGYFTIENLEPGDYVIYADMHGYTMALGGVMTFDGSGMNYDVVLCANDTLDEIDMCNVTTSVKVQENDLSLELVPNPANESVRIYGDFNNAAVSIVDLNGKIVYQTNLISGSIIETNQLPAGIYVVRIKSDEISSNQKLVINR